MRRWLIRNRYLLGWRRALLPCSLLIITLMLIIYSGRWAQRSGRLAVLAPKNFPGPGQLAQHAKAFYHRINSVIGNFSVNRQVLLGPASMHFAYHYNVSKNRLSALLADTMQLLELHKSAQKRLAYMLSIHPHYDANSGSCRCRSVSEPCRCCARVALKSLRLEQTVCVDFQYRVHSQALRTRILLGSSTVVVDQLLGAQQPPMLCAGSSLELCARFRNTSYTVTLHSDHKTRLQGCLDLLVNLSNVTISAYPMGCFEATDPIQAPLV